MNDDRCKCKYSVLVSAFILLLVLVQCLSSCIDPAWAGRPETPFMPGITGVVVVDGSNPSTLYRARLGFDAERGRYFVKGLKMEYPVHRDITATVFWIGEEAGSDNGWITNLHSAWDEDWVEHYGGIDDPDHRNGFFPAGFVPRQNPFYVALPCNDLDEQGNSKPQALRRVYWAAEHATSAADGASILKDRWVRISRGGKQVYAQWEDAGPFGEDDWDYVFGQARPSNTKNQSAGIDLSPAVRDYLGLSGMDKVDWQFVDYEDVPAGPWLFVTTVSGKAWFRPLSQSTFYWQLQGEIDTNVDAEIYDIDLFDVSSQTIDALHAAGKRVICYFSAGSSESWRDDFSKFDRSVLGKALDGWPGERWLDIRSENVRSIMVQRLELARSKGCDGVEPDNVDGYSNDTGFPLTYEDQLDYNRFLASEAHQRGLAVFLKNDLEQARDLVRHFDALLLESCMEYQECRLAAPFIDSLKPVFDVEYDASLRQGSRVKDSVCQKARDLGISLMLMNEDLDGSLYLRCPK